VRNLPREEWVSQVPQGHRIEYNGGMGDLSGMPPQLVAAHHPWVLGLRSLAALQTVYVGAYCDVAWVDEDTGQTEVQIAGGLVQRVELQPITYQQAHLMVPVLQFDWGYESPVRPNAAIRACRDDSHTHQPRPQPPCPLADPITLRPACRPLPAEYEPIAAQAMANLLHNGGMVCSRPALEQIAQELEDIVRSASQAGTAGCYTLRVAAQAELVRKLLGATEGNPKLAR